MKYLQNLLTEQHTYVHDKVLLPLLLEHFASGAGFLASGNFWSMISAFGFPRFSMFSSLKSFHGLAWVYWCHLQTELIEWLLKNQFRSFPSTMDYHVHTCSRSVMPDSFVIPWTVVRQAPLSRSFPGKNTGVGCHFLLQGIFPTRDWTFISWVFCVGRWVLYQ